MAGIFTGMAAMAALAIWMRGRGADARLVPAMARLALFALGLKAGLLAGWQPWRGQVLILPRCCRMALARLSAGSRGQRRWARSRAVLAAGPLVSALAGPALAATKAAEAGAGSVPLPWLLAALAGVGLFWLVLCLGTLVAGGHRRGLPPPHASARISAAPPRERMASRRCSSTQYPALDLLSLGRVSSGRCPIFSCSG